MTSKCLWKCKVTIHNAYKYIHRNQKNLAMVATAVLISVIIGCLAYYRWLDPFLGTKISFPNHVVQLRSARLYLLFLARAIIDSQRQPELLQLYAHANTKTHELTSNEVRFFFMADLNLRKYTASMVVKRGVVSINREALENIVYKWLSGWHQITGLTRDQFSLSPSERYTPNIDRRLPWRAFAFLEPGFDIGLGQHPSFPYDINYNYLVAAEDASEILKVAVFGYRKHDSYGQFDIFELEPAETPFSWTYEEPGTKYLIIRMHLYSVTSMRFAAPPEVWIELETEPLFQLPSPQVVHSRRMAKLLASLSLSTMVFTFFHSVITWLKRE